MTEDYEFEIKDTWKATHESFFAKRPKEKDR